MCLFYFMRAAHEALLSVPMPTCEDRLASLQRQFQSLLLAAGERNVSAKRSYVKGQLSLNRLVAGGFRPKVAKVVYAKMMRSGRPMSHYSKSTGKLKKRL